MRKRVTTGWHVQVDPLVRRWFGCDEKERIAEEKSECDRIIAEIQRHVDTCFAKRLEDVEYQCEHCGSAWTEADDSPHNGGCCDKDEEALNAEDTDA